MTRRQGQTSVIHSKKFVVTAAIAVIITGVVLGSVAGIVPVPAWTETWAAEEAWRTMDDKSRINAALSSRRKAAKKGRVSTPTSTEQRGSLRQPSGFITRIGRRLARVLRWSGRNRSGSTQTTTARQQRPQAMRKNKNAPQRGRTRTQVGAGTAVSDEDSPEMDSTKFGVGSVGLGLGGNGGPIGFGAAPIAGASDPNLEYDSYFDPNEEIPTVQPTERRSR